MGIYPKQKKKEKIMKGITAIQFSCVISGLVLDNHFRNYLNQNVQAEQNFRQVPFLFKRGYDADGTERKGDTVNYVKDYSMRQLPFLFKRTPQGNKQTRGEPGVAIPFLF